MRPPRIAVRPSPVDGGPVVFPRSSNIVVSDDGTLAVEIVQWPDASFVTVRHFLTDSGDVTYEMDAPSVPAAMDAEGLTYAGDRMVWR